MHPLLVAGLVGVLAYVLTRKGTSSTQPTPAATAATPNYSYPLSIVFNGGNPVSAAPRPSPQAQNAAIMQPYASLQPPLPSAGLQQAVSNVGNSCRARGGSCHKPMHRPSSASGWTDGAGGCLATSPASQAASARAQIAASHKCPSNSTPGLEDTSSATGGDDTVAYNQANAAANALASGPTQLDATQYTQYVNYLFGLESASIINPSIPEDAENAFESTVYRANQVSLSPNASNNVGFDIYGNPTIGANVQAVATAQSPDAIMMQQWNLAHPGAVNALG